MADLTTIDVVRQAIPRLASVADAEVSRLISESSGIVESWCNRTFGPGTYTEVYDLDGSGRLFLRQRPITGITSVTVGLPDAPHVLTAPQFDPLTGEVRASGSGGWWPDSPFPFEGFWLGYGFQTCQVVYSAGEAVPKAVEGRCLAILNRIASGLALQTTLRAKSLGNVSFTYGDPTQFMAITDDDRRILSPYRIYSL